jgi:hypothetical protein
VGDNRSGLDKTDADCSVGTGSMQFPDVDLKLACEGTVIFLPAV